jgi:hypothetical protein
MTDDDQLVALAGDTDASFTMRLYDFNEPRKVAMRRTRRERFEEWRLLCEEGPQLIEDLLGRFEAADGGESARLFLLAAEQLRSATVRAWRDILRYRAIPLDADSDCRCGVEDLLTLPIWLEEQTIQLDG